MGLASTAAKLLASLDLDTKPFERGAQRAGAVLGRMESRFKKIGSLANQGIRNAAANLTRIGIVAGGVLVASVTAGVRSLEELERVTNATAGVIESTGGKAGITAKQVRDLAQSLESVTTADDKVIQSGENLLLTFTNIGQKAFPQATKAMVDLGIAMAQGDVANADFKSSAIQIGKALNDPVKGFTALRRVGVSFTADQEKRIKRLVAEGKLYKAQKIILDELETEFGKAGEAAGKGFGADMRRAKDAIEDAQQALATGFLPLISRASKWISTTLANPTVQADIRKFGDSLAGGFDKLLEVGGRLPWAQIGDSLKVAGAGAKAIFDAFTGLPPWIQTAVLTGWGLNKLTGGALGGIGSELFKGLAGGFGNALVKAGIGKAFVQPVFVTNMGAGIGGGPAVGGTGKGGLGLLGFLGLAGLGAVLGTVLRDAFDAAAPDISRDLRTEIRHAFGLRDAVRTDANGNPITVGFNPSLRTSSVAQPFDGKVGRTLRVYGEVEDKKGQINWTKISRATERTNAKLAEQRRAIEQTNTRVDAMKSAMARDLAGVRTQTRTSGVGIEGAIRALNLTNRITINVPGQRPRVYQTGGTLNRTGSGSGPGGPVSADDLY